MKLPFRSGNGESPSSHAIPPIERVAFGRVFVRGVCGSILIFCLSGCALIPPNSFLDPTKVGMYPMDYHESGIRRVLTPREAPYGITDATEPTPDDLVPVFEEYRIFPLDTVQVGINDLIETGRAWEATLEVSNTGYIRVPYLGAIRVTGMTESELEQDLRARVQDAHILPDPIVRVIISVKRELYFTALGDVRNQGAFSLARPNTRLLEALALMNGVGSNAKKLYIIRRTESAPSLPSVPAQPQPESNLEDLVIPPPDDEASFGGTVFSRMDASSAGAQLASAQETDTSRDELDALLRPAGQSTRPAESAPSMPGESGFRPLIYDPATGAMQEAPSPEDVERPAASTPETEPTAAPTSSVYDWEDIPEFELTQRVLEIDLEALKSGDPRYNIVIHNHDAIYVPEDTAVFYLMGEIARPGVYGFGGREITLKQAIAIGNGFGALAWPERTEIIRREPGTDKQITVRVNLDAIFAGLEDDVLLRGDDIVHIGTHTIAPFLFVLRNSFRFTYGFGFVYDRNFADQDSIAGKANPETVERARRQSLGLPF